MTLEELQEGAARIPPDYRLELYVEAQFFQNEEIIIGRRFDRTMDPLRPPRELAIAWAHEWRRGIEEGEL